MEIIGKQDFRTVSPEVRVEIRKRGMSMIEKGRRKGEVARLLGVNKNTVSNWCKAYKANGMEGLSDKKRGTKSEDKKLLLTRPEHFHKIILHYLSGEALLLSHGNNRKTGVPRCFEWKRCES